MFKNHGLFPKCYPCRWVEVVLTVLPSKFYPILLHPIFRPKTSLMLPLSSGTSSLIPFDIFQPNRPATVQTLVGEIEKKSLLFQQPIPEWSDQADTGK